MVPIIPHLANECLNDLLGNKSYYWPEVDNKYLQKKEQNIVVQINGKKRSLILTENNIEEKDLITKIRKIKDLEKFLDGKNIIKSIFIKNKLINLIVK